MTALDKIDMEIEQGSFVAILGQNGSGKSTLAKHFNALLLPSSGTVWVDGLDTSNGEHTWKVRQSCGMVFQNPDNQIIATTVEEDIAFGLENLGIPSAQIREKVNAALATVNMEGHGRDTPGFLSGGQKQRIAIAGIIAMRPQCIVFDEPTAMLDPIGRAGVISAINTLVSEGITVILITHFMEEAIRAQRVIVMNDGQIVMDDTPKNIFSQVDKIKSLGLDVPQITELAHGLIHHDINAPKDILTIEDMLLYLQKQKWNQEKPNQEKMFSLADSESASFVDKKTAHISIQNLTHVYSEGTAFEKLALEDINIDIERGSFVGIIGHTGSGKSTLIQHLNSLLKPSSGKIFLNNKDINEDKENLKSVRQRVGLVFQYPEHQLFETTVYKDVAFGPINMGFSGEELKKKVEKALELVALSPDLHEKSPFNLSGGQKRRAAIAGILAMEPEVLILDEPTAGLDPKGRDEILQQIDILHKKTNNTIILVSHSMEDVARLAEKIIVLQDGKVKYTGTPKQVFSYAKELEEIGLAAPQISYLIKGLEEAGMSIRSDIFTVPEAIEEILRRLE